MRLAIDRIALLLVALLAVELLELLDFLDVFSVVSGLFVAIALAFVFLWGRSVVSLLFGKNV